MIRDALCIGKPSFFGGQNSVSDSYSACSDEVKRAEHLSFCVSLSDDGEMCWSRCRSRLTTPNSVRPSPWVGQAFGYCSSSYDPSKHHFCMHQAETQTLSCRLSCATTHADNGLYVIAYKRRSMQFPVSWSFLGGVARCYSHQSRILLP